MKKNILANIIGRFWSILSNFLFVPLYIKFLGFDSYSIISFTLVISGLMAILDSGLTATLSREFSRSDIQKDQKYSIFKTLEALYLGIVAVSIVFLFVFSEVVAENWITNVSFKPSQIIFFLRIISFEIGFQLMFRFYIGGLLGIEKQVTANLLQIGWGFFRNGLVVLLIYFYNKLEFFFMWQSCCTIVFAIIMKLVLEYYVLGKMTFSVNFKIDMDVLKGVKKFALGMLLISLVAALNTQLDKLMITKLLSMQSLGVYTIAISLAQGLIVLISPIGTAVLPRFTAYYSSGQIESANDLYKKVNSLIIIIVFSIAATMIFYSYELIWIWTGDKTLALNVQNILPITAVTMAMIALQILPFNIAISNGYTKLNNILGISSIFVTLPGYWLATKFYGLVGASSMYCAVQIITTVIYYYFINKRYMKFSFYDIYIKQFLLPIGITLVCTFVASEIPHNNFEGKISMLFWIASTTGITLILTTCSLLSVEEIKSIFKLKSK